MQAAHVVIDKLHETQAVAPENDLRAWHLVGLADADSLHWPIGVQGGSFSVSRDIADLLKSPTRGEPLQRRVSTVGTLMVCCRQVVFLGRPYAGQTVTVHVSDTTITVELDGQIRVTRRTTDVPVRNVKANKPHGAP
ncbi:hypothetical protein QFZ55_003790 [Streptomyces luteogriseus]|uniref:hypothetical protein n=1 Tax=Streptomyces luteogriseus TaxID=68233 RepID=UPI002786D453|nr:hypothetical protein [Streptomyces luteogriseus]MDQ0714338.1 hypothetical protein [Streptomyces luteogriseus]